MLTLFSPFSVCPQALSGHPPILALVNIPVCLLLFSKDQFGHLEIFFCNFAFFNLHSMSLSHLISLCNI